MAVATPKAETKTEIKAAGVEPTRNDASVTPKASALDLKPAVK